MTSRNLKTLKKVLIAIYVVAAVCGIGSLCYNIYQEKELGNRLQKTDYAYDTLIDDLIKYSCLEASSDFYQYFLLDDFPYKKFLAKNSSIENLIDKTLIAKMKESNISSDSVYHLAMAFPNSWNEHKKFVVYDEIYKCYKPLFSIYLEEEGKNTFKSKISQTIKETLEVPGSFGIYNPENSYYKLYVKCFNGDTSYYVNNAGEYNEEIYFYVKYYAIDSSGIPDIIGAWLSYSSEGNYGSYKKFVCKP